MAIVGGTGTIVGPFLGAAVVLGLRNWVSSFVEMHHAIMGAVFIATVLWAPQGLVGIAARIRARLSKDRHG
jgi:branched-chain amino acid transport system permease protein